MKLAIVWASVGRHLMVASFFIYLSNSTILAHPIVFSEYKLQQVEEQWELSFTQKTSYLRDAIYASRPDLKGISLNSEAFLKATTQYITNTLTLKYDGDRLQLTPQLMSYGGLKFQSSFLVDGLPKKPDYLFIKTEGFDVHEHSIVLFQVTEGKDGYLNYFNRKENLATYDFTSHHYYFEEITTEEKPQVWRYILLIAVIGGMLTYLYRRSRLIKTTA